MSMYRSNKERTLFLSSSRDGPLPAFRLGLCLLAVAVCAFPAVAAVVSLGQPEFDAGGYWAPVTVTSESDEQVASLQFDFQYDSSRFELAEVYPGEAADQAGKDVMLSRISEDAGRLLVVGVNQNIIEDGPVAVMFLSPLDKSGESPKNLRLDNVVLSDPVGERVEARTESPRDETQDADSETDSSERAGDSGQRDASEEASGRPAARERQSLRDTLKDTLAGVFGRRDQPAGEGAAGAPVGSAEPEAQDTRDDDSGRQTARRRLDDWGGLGGQAHPEDGQRPVPQSDERRRVDDTSEALREYAALQEPLAREIAEQTRRDASRTGSAGGAEGAGAMSRDAVVYGLAAALVVVAAIWVWRRQFAFNPPHGKG